MRERLADFQGRRYTMELRSEIARAAKEIDDAARVPTMFQIETPDGSLVTTFMVTGGQKPSAPQGPLHIDVSRLPEPLRSTTQARLAPFEGQPYTPALRNLVTKALSEVGPQARWALIPQRKPEDGSLGTTLWVVLTEAGAGLGSGVGPGLAPGFPPSGRPRIPIAGFVQAVKLIQSSPPEYPPLARQARIQGTVRFNAVIDTAGRVANIALVSGHPLLVPAAQAVVKEYFYQPTLLNGEPVEVTTQIDVNFTLPQP
jgi:TonB family protein